MTTPPGVVNQPIKVMKNVKMNISEKGILTVTVDLSKSFGLSTSGKSKIIATTEGNVAVATDPSKAPVMLGLNVYTKA